MQDKVSIKGKTLHLKFFKKGLIFKLLKFGQIMLIQKIKKSKLKLKESFTMHNFKNIILTTA